MRGALNGHTKAVIQQHHPELVEFERLPVGEQEAFRAALDEFLEHRGAGLAPAEQAVAYHVGRAMWRRSWAHGWSVEGRQMRAGMADEPQEVA